MITIESLVEQGANVKLEVTPADLKMFAESIVQRTMAARQEELDAEKQRAAEETWLNTKQVRELLNVCEGTLNLWAKRGYLVPVKVGNKNMYAKSDVRRVQTGGKSESVTSYCKKKKCGTVCHTLYLKVVGNHRCRCNNSSPRYMRENHYAILASN